MTDSFKEQMLFTTIVPALHFMGHTMLFPYTWNGERRFATIKLEQLINIVKWDIKPE